MTRPDWTMDKFGELFREVSANMRRMAEGDYPRRVAEAVDLIEQALTAGRKLLVFGNGGSAADAQHLTAELVGRFAAERRPLPAIALGTNHALVTAWSNDRTFDELFAREIEALGAAGDVALGISTSGRSPNVVHGLACARRRGLSTIGLTGGEGGELPPLCDLLLAVPLEETARIQEVHLVTYHAICAELERRLLAASA